MLIKLHIRNNVPIYFTKEHIAAFFSSPQGPVDTNTTVYAVGITFFVRETVEEIYQLLNGTPNGTLTYESTPSLPEVKRVVKKKIVKKKGKR
jgi:hypothetical protein